MGGITALKKLQLGIETTKGTATTATVIWRGKAQGKDARVLVQAGEEIGQLIPKDRLYEAYQLGQVTMPEVEATFEQLPFILACGVENLVTGVADTGGSGKIYEFNHGVATAQTLKSATLQVGDNQRVDIFDYGMVRSFTLKGTAKDAWRMSAEWFAQAVTDGDFTTGLSATAVEEILFGNTRLYIDDTAGTIGTTTKTATFLGGSIADVTGAEALFTGDGATTLTQEQVREAKITGSIIVEHDATGEDEITHARAHDVRLLKIIATGSNLATAGSTYSKKTFIFQAAIMYDGVPSTADKEGDQTVELPWHVVDSDSIVPTYIVVNEDATLLS